MLPDRSQHVDTTGGPDIPDVDGDLTWMDSLGYEDLIRRDTPSPTMCPESPPMPEPEPQYMDDPMPEHVPHDTLKDDSAADNTRTDPSRRITRARAGHTRSRPRESAPTSTTTLSTSTRGMLSASPSSSRALVSAISTLLKRRQRRSSRYSWESARRNARFRLP